jgi:hypothetical protein
VTLGFLGTGEVDKEQAAKLIDDHIEARASNEDPVRFYFIVQTGQWTDTLTEITEMTSRIGIPFEAITKTTDRGKRDFVDITKMAVKVHNVENPVGELLKLLEGSPGPHLLVLYDNTTMAATDEIASRFVNAGIPAWDLTDGMTPLQFEDQPEAPEEPGEEDEPGEEEGEETEEGEGTEEESGLYTRTELEGLNRDELKQVADRLGVQRRRASMQMIEEILAVQQGSETAAEESESEVVPEEEPVPPIQVTTEVVPPAQFTEEFTTALQAVLTSFLGELTRQLAETLGTIQAAAPVAAAVSEESTSTLAAVPDSEEPPRRRRRLGEAPTVRRVVRSRD